MDKARELSFIKDFWSSLVAHLEKEPENKIKEKLENDFYQLYQKGIKKPVNERKALENQLIHNPKKIVGYLKKFTEPTNIKYATHIWDGNNGKGYKGYDDFIEKLNVDIEDTYKFWEMPKYKPQLYWSLIFPFLFQKKLTKTQKIGDFNWGRYSLKVGWQYPPDILKTNSVDKRPYDVEIPEELRPKGLINRKRLIYFQDFIDIFKSEIEFRRNDLYALIRRLTSSMTADFKIQIEDIKGLSFYTHCLKVEEALRRIFKNMDTVYPNIFIKGIIKSDKIIIEILQKGSYCYKSLDDDKLNLKEEKGEFILIKKSLFSLCDWSIQSKFRDGKYYEFNYLTPEMLELSSPKIEEIDFDPGGFKHILTFYL